MAGKEEEKEPSLGKTEEEISSGSDNSRGAVIRRSYGRWRNISLVAAVGLPLLLVACGDANKSDIAAQATVTASDFQDKLNKALAAQATATANEYQDKLNKAMSDQSAAAEDKISKAITPINDQIKKDSSTLADLNKKLDKMVADNQLVEPTIEPAPKSGDKWSLSYPDGNKRVDVSLAPGFTPDKALYTASDIKPLPLGNDWVAYQDWEKLLNTGRGKGNELAGFNYDYNDECMVPKFWCNIQADMFAWRVFQGQQLRVPGIGTLVGAPRRSVVLLVLNLDGSVHPWDVDNNGPVYIKRGFTATGRLWDGQKNVDQAEQLLDEHWLSKQALGENSKSYIGITDSPENALETLLVSVQRKQWGNNPDGSKREEFQLIRSELVKLK